jgi:hypothetical protein
MTTPPLFAADSVARKPLLASTKLVSLTDPRTVALRSFGRQPAIAVNCKDWSVPVYWTKSTDPQITITFRDGDLKVLRVRVPAGVKQSPDSDGLIAAIDGYLSYEMWQFKWDGYSSVATASFGGRVDLTGSGQGGTRAAMLSHLLGLMMTDEILAMVFEHILAIALPTTALKHGYVSPAISEDSNGATAYSGVLPMGTRARLDPKLDLTTLGLSPIGLAAARAAQKYGVVVVDASGGMAFYAQQQASLDPVAAARIEQLKLDLPKIVSQLRVLA